MPNVHPFRPIQFVSSDRDVSKHVSPPYDVIGAPERAKLAENAKNIVEIDLPHTPAKELGPPEAYQGAADTLASWLDAGTLAQRETPAMFAYRQTFEFRGETYQRCGMVCTIETAPFGPRDGGGVLAHEQTFSGPKEDRMALMRATQAQTSPVFGLHPDESGAGSKTVRAIMDSREPDRVARLAETDGQVVLHEIWEVEDESSLTQYQDALRGEDVFIADGHHRYTTAINYLRSLEEQGAVPDDHPARRTMIVLVGMSDPGLAIGPTHRVLGGMEGYTAEQFIEAAGGYLDIKPVENDPHMIEDAIDREATISENVFGVYDFATGLCWVANPTDGDPLADRFAEKPESWRQLDVAIIQHMIVEEICEPELNAGNPVKWAFPHSIEEVVAIGKGEETGAGGGSGFAQLALIVRPTPLEAVRDICQANELMPQKSTFFYPKLATGLFIHPLS